jgi:hypothetical protein
LAKQIPRLPEGLKPRMNAWTNGRAPKANRALLSRGFLTRPRGFLTRAQETGGSLAALNRYAKPNLGFACIYTPSTAGQASNDGGRKGVVQAFSGAEQCSRRCSVVTNDTFNFAVDEVQVKVDKAPRAIDDTRGYKLGCERPQVFQ